MKVIVFPIITLVILSCAIKVNGEVLKNDRKSQIYRKYVDMDKQLRHYVDKGIKMLLPFVLEASEHVNISSKCMHDLFQFLSGLSKLTDWSIRFLDATGRQQSGLLAGNVQMYGEFNECFDTIVKRKDKIDFRGQYCSIIVKPVLPVIDDIHYGYQSEELENLTKKSSDFLKLMTSHLYELYYIKPKIGVCVPSGCTEEDVSQMVSYLAEQMYINATVLHCLKKEDMSYWTNSKIIVACVFGFLGLLLIVSTILDNTLEKWKKNDLGRPGRLLQCFSATRNFSELIDINTNEDTITCFFGIRVMSIFWIILCHEYLVHTVALVSNHGKDGISFIQSFFGQIVMNGFTASEIFFFMGGFVNCYGRVKLQASGKYQRSVFQLIYHRLWRIYPTLIVAFLVYILLNTSVPSFLDIQLNGPCSKHWWRNLLFINNLYRPFDTCLTHTWYVAADMQMFLLSLFTVPVLLRNEKLGMYLHIGVICITNACCFIMWWILNLPPNVAVLSAGNSKDWRPSQIDYNTNIYMLPLLHIASYYIGIVLGYVIASKKIKQFSKVTSLIGWSSATFLYIFTIFFTYRWNSGTQYTKLESSLYAPVSKTVLVLCIAWVVYCSNTGQARFVNYTLSLKMWIPISKLTYMAYMISLLVQIYYISNLNFPPDFSSMFIIWGYFGNMCISYLMSLVLVLLVESPLLNMEKILFPGRQKENKSLPDLPKGITLTIHNGSN